MGELDPGKKTEISVTADGVKQDGPDIPGWLDKLIGEHLVQPEGGRFIITEIPSPSNEQPDQTS